MVSQKQLAANQQNALSSTGPRTAEGKSRSSRNAIKHGLLSKQVVLSTESQREFNGFRMHTLTSLCPEGEIELLLADLVVASAWRLRRVMQVRREMLESIIQENRDDLERQNWVDRCIEELGFNPRYALTEEQETKADVIWQEVPEPKVVELGPVLAKDLKGNSSEIHRYEREYLSDMYKALRELHRVQALRRGQPVLPPLAVDLSISGNQARNN